MQVLINELKHALNSKLYFTALNTALIIPDICSALQSDNGQTSGTKYKEWFNKYCGQNYKDFINADDIYKIRCASLHQGKLNHDNPRFDRILFQIPNAQNNVFDKILIDRCINLNLVIFIDNVIKGYEKWYIENEANQIVLNNIENSINYYPEGIFPLMIGIPLIG